MKTNETERTGKSKPDSEWIYGLNPLKEAVRSGRNIKCIFVSSSRRDKLSEIKKDAREKNIPLKIMPPSFFDSRFKKGHQGIAAEVSPKKSVTIDELLDIPLKKNDVPFFLILDCIEDPRNFGAIMRVAEAAGVHGIVIQSHRSARLGPDVSKSSAGAIEYVSVAIVSNIKLAINQMKEVNITIVGADAEAEKNLWELDLTLPLALIIGSEGKGIRKTIKEKCDVLAKLPMFGKINSLNVSVAAGIFSFEILRQRIQKK